MNIFTNLRLSRTAAATVALGCALVAHAGPERPFKAGLELEQRLGRLTKCPGLDGQPGPGGTLNGTGRATHLGAVELQGSHCVLSRPGDTFYVFNGEMRWTAANGDVLLADYSGYYTPVSPGVYAFDGHYAIKDGTGRFQDASGLGALSGTLNGSFSANPQALSLSFDGKIRY